MMFMRDNSIFTPVSEPNMAPDRAVPAILPVDERITSYCEIETTYSEEQALSESSRCLKCPTHWCQKACPAGVPVTDFIAQVRAGNYEAAYQVIRSASTLPEMCSRVCPQYKQCQSNCTRGIRTEAVGIGKLERFVIEQHYASGNVDPKAASTGKRVAVIGSGPSGLSVAERLTDKGHAVTIFEASDRAGGLLEYGIPNMKLEKGVVARKVSAMAARGVEFKLSTIVDNSNAAEILESYDAVVLCAGTGNARTLKLEGEAVGVIPALDFLTSTTKSLLDSNMTDGQNISAKGKNVVIVGGGDTGSDCVGTAIRNGCASLTQIEMLPQNPVRVFIHGGNVRKEDKKVDTSMEEAVSVFGADPHVYQTTLKAVEADENGILKAVVTVDLAATFDEGGRMTLSEIAGSEKSIPCEMLVVAAGFIGPKPELAQAFGLTQEAGSASDIYSTNVAKVFACGDCRTGQSLVVKAMVDGRECANAVDAYLN